MTYTILEIKHNTLTKKRLKTFGLCKFFLTFVDSLEYQLKIPFEICGDCNIVRDGLEIFLIRSEDPFSVYRPFLVGSEIFLTGIC